MPRDYLREASSVIFGDKISLASLVETDIDGVLDNLFRVFFEASGMTGPSMRKAAAYAIGQVGDPRTLVPMREAYRQEPDMPPGVQEAMRASITAIKLAPNADGYSQLDRCQIIEDVYDGSRPPDWE
jgi:hypothetical protein